MKKALQCFAPNRICPCVLLLFAAILGVRAQTLPSSLSLRFQPTAEIPLGKSSSVYTFGGSALLTAAYQPPLGLPIYVSGDDHLFFQEYVPASGWYTEDDLYYDTVSGEDITQTFVFFLASDFKPHLFFVSANSLYHTVRTGSGSINPDPPEELVAGINTVDIERINTDELAIAYTDTAAKNLYFRTYHDTQAETVWTAGDPDTVIASIDIAVDATGAVHICFATKDSTAPVLDPSGSAIRYVCNQQGTWTEMDAILGNDQAGPDTIMPHAITLSTGKFGNPRLHLVYSLLKDGLNFYIWYAYFDKGSWHAAKESIDTVNTNSFWTSAMIGADGGGNVHIVYSWAVNELDRTLMYVRGSPTEPQ